jgi:cytochrome c oxidase assembly factor CtaG
MLQHELLIMVTAPLALLSAPWMPLWRGVPLTWRRLVLRPLGRRPQIFPILRRVGHTLGSPVFAWLFYVVDLTVWHLPFFYDLTEANKAIHYTEHALFLVTALFFWGQVIPSFPFKPRLGYAGQLVYMFTATVHGNALDWFLLSATTPIYGYYAALPRAPGMVSAVVDEHLAAGIMMSATMFAFILMLVVIAGLWLAEEERRTAVMDAALAGEQQS